MEFSHENFVDTVRHAIRLGLGGYALTEHFHATHYWDAMHELAERYPYENGALRVAPGFNILTGAEIDIAEGGHIVTLGRLDALEWLYDLFGDGFPFRKFPTFDELVTAGRQADVIFIAAHPTREQKYLAKLGNELARLDALEVSGKDLCTSPVDRIVGGMAAELDVAVVGSSDAHVWAQIGAQATIVDLDELTLEGLRDTLAKQHTAHRALPHLVHIVEVAKNHKRVLKQAAAAIQDAVPRRLAVAA